MNGGGSKEEIGRQDRSESLPVVTVLRADDLDERTRRQLVRLLNEAFERHRWLFPNDRTDYEQFVAETAGAEVLVLAGEPAGSGGHDEHGAPAAEERETSREIAGMAVIHPEGEALYIGMVAVAPAAQGKGCGGRLLRAAEALAGERGLHAISLTTVPELGNAVYWRRHGFVVTAEERRPAGYWGATMPHTFVWMEKRLD